MATSLIRLEDGTLVEADVPDDHPQYVSGGEAEKVASSLDKIRALLVQVGRELSGAWRDFESDDLRVTGVQAEIAVGFEGEGNVYIAKARASANLTLTLTCTRPED